jgi:hypothetical protein
VRRLDTIKRFATALGNTTAALVVREDGVTFTLKIATRIYRPSSQQAQEIRRLQPHDSVEFEAEAPPLNVPKRHSPPNTRADKDYGRRLVFVLEASTQTHPDTHTYTHTYTRTHTGTHMIKRGYARAHTCTRTHIHTHSNEKHTGQRAHPLHAEDDATEHTESFTCGDEGRQRPGNSFLCRGGEQTRKNE